MSTALVLPRPVPETPVFRTPPHNQEAEQALLGAILVNNEALDRVSSFLQSRHFINPLHGRIYESTSQLIRGGKRATPITLKTYFENELPIGDLTVPQYLGRGPSLRCRIQSRESVACWFVSMRSPLGWPKEKAARARCGG